MSHNKPPEEVPKNNALAISSTCNIIYAGISLHLEHNVITYALVRAKSVHIKRMSNLQVFCELGLS